MPNVLFVDDDPLLMRALKRDFSIEFDLSVAYSASEAQAILAGARVMDIVITDFSMPGMDGLDFIEEVASMYPRTRFLVLTGKADRPTIERSASIPAVFRLLTKPCSKSEILHAIQDALAVACTEH